MGGAVYAEGDGRIERPPGLDLLLKVGGSGAARGKVLAWLAPPGARG